MENVLRRSAQESSGPVACRKCGQQFRQDISQRVFVHDHVKTIHANLIEMRDGDEKEDSIESLWREFAERASDR